ncbi:bleomycin resistance protein [Niastella koreensis]|uniref:Glyoxalase/bleomycin resistance protein/dioxygenase n=2 Tax=Niastella koreensis TaxID=354356 RepID=G8TA19_NIAKG|nr:glyoxalase/bleomycin resistance/extradiol dioxygenase family protein [Niastella koreensis]AEW02391.1 Glyoxalase/bleomycin resistance protein/dioxygenase [Niastella koreensis GR20-10]OQP54770.1 bleomycin resistance protein [Niastella koreensis]
MEIRLIVIRTVEIERLANFYTLLGLTFEYHKHGKSPYHYSAPVGNTILEIYPLAKGQTEADKELRLGFALDDFDNTMTTLKERSVEFVSEPIQTDYGFMAIIKDPDGRRIELYKK